MSLSPTTSASYSEPAGHKRRRTNDFDNHPFLGGPVGMAHPHDLAASQGNLSQGPPPSPAHIPKRGARACTACRKGKNRCEGEVSRPFSISIFRRGLNAPRRPDPRHHGPLTRPARLRPLGTLSSLSAQWYALRL